jgi:hypothetical protein
MVAMKGSLALKNVISAVKLPLAAACFFLGYRIGKIQQIQDPEKSEKAAPYI